MSAAVALQLIPSRPPPVATEGVLPWLKRNLFSDWKNTFVPCGTWLATSVGMPMPRFTSMPSRSSCAMRLAMIV